MSGEPPVPARPNLHNAIALALHKRTQEPDKVLVDGVYKLIAENAELRTEVAELRARVAAAEAGPDLFTAFDDREAS